MIGLIIAVVFIALLFMAMAGSDTFDLSENLLAYLKDMGEVCIFVLIFGIPIGFLINMFKKK